MFSCFIFIVCKDVHIRTVWLIPWQVVKICTQCLSSSVTLLWIILSPIQKVTFVSSITVRLFVSMTDWLTSSFMSMLRVISVLVIRFALICPFLWSITLSCSRVIKSSLLVVYISMSAKCSSSYKNWSIPIALI